MLISALLLSALLGQSPVERPGWNRPVDDERSFERLRRLDGDLFLANHPVFFNLETKRKRMASAAKNPFIDPSELQRFVNAFESEFRMALAKQRGSERR